MQFIHQFLNLSENSKHKIDKGNRKQNLRVVLLFHVSENLSLPVGLRYSQFHCLLLVKCIDSGLYPIRQKRQPFTKCCLALPTFWGALEDTSRKLQSVQAGVSVACCQALRMTLILPFAGAGLLRARDVRRSWPPW